MSSHSYLFFCLFKTTKIGINSYSLNESVKNRLVLVCRPTIYYWPCQRKHDFPKSTFLMQGHNYYALKNVSLNLLSLTPFISVVLLTFIFSFFLHIFCNYVDCAHLLKYTIRLCFGDILNFKILNMLLEYTNNALGSFWIFSHLFKRTKFEIEINKTYISYIQDFF